MAKEQVNEIKYKSPEILMIDCEKSVSDKLREKGFCIEEGTFGNKYKIYDSTSEKLGEKNECLKNIVEKDIIIINMHQNELKLPVDLKNTSSLEDGTYSVTKRYQKKYNPINLSSYDHKAEFNTLRKKKSVFIVFADELVTEKYLFLQLKNEDRNTNEKAISNYDFLPFNIFIQKNIKNEKYEVADNDIAKLIFKKYNGKIWSNCTFYVNRYADVSAPLLENMYGETIGYIEVYAIEDSANTFFVLPQCENMEIIIENILTNVLPEIYPNMFPDFTKDTWVDKEEYLLPDVKALMDEKQKLQKEYEIKLQDLDNKIMLKKKENSFLYEILMSTGTGDVLVDNIIKCLEYLEYYKIVNWDKENEKGNLEEDLHIYINEKEYYVAEVKGVNGPPIEDDCDVIIKYKLRNCKRSGVSSIHGIVFFNYRRGVEPSIRDKLGFSEKEIEDALIDDYTLVGTYELFKAIRLCQENIISKASVRENLATPGLFKAVPLNFEKIGKIDLIYKKLNVICMPLECEKIEVGDELLIVENNSYSKVKVESLQIDDKDVAHAKFGDKVGIRIDEGVPDSRSAEIFLMN